MSKRAKRGKVEKARTTSGREGCSWRRGRRRIGVLLAVSPDERATDTETVRAAGHGVVNSGLRVNSGSCISVSSDFRSSGTGCSSGSAYARRASI